MTKGYAKNNSFGGWLKFSESDMEKLVKSIKTWFPVMGSVAALAVSMGAQTWFDTDLKLALWMVADVVLFGLYCSYLRASVMKRYPTKAILLGGKMARYAVIPIALLTAYIVLLTSLSEGVFYATLWIAAAYCLVCLLVAGWRKAAQRA